MKSDKTQAFFVQRLIRKKKLIKLFAISIAFIALAGCFFQRMGVQGELKGYSGDGKLELLVRQTGFAGETYGYALMLPAFKANMAGTHTYELTGLPLRKDVIHAELATFVPIFSEPIAEADRRALHIQVDHRFACQLVDGQSRRVFGKFSGPAASLSDSQTLQFQGSKFMKHLFKVNLTEVTETGNLLLQVKNEIGPTPLEGWLQIVLLVDAPASK